MSDETTFNTAKLDKLMKALSLEGPIGRVGILGDKTQRTPKEGEGFVQSNALIGAVHEFGSSTHPQRSFLRIPLKNYLGKAIEGSNISDKLYIENVIKFGTVKPWVEKVMILAEGVVIQGFATQGYGEWQAWKTPGYENNTGQILKDTQQLSESITHELAE